MRFTLTFSVLSSCLFLTGCTGLDLNSKTDLAFHEPDPFLTDGGLTGGNYPAEPMASGPAGVARIMDTDTLDVPQAEYPTLVEVAMPLIPTGAEDTKPTGSVSQVPKNLVMDDSTNRPEAVVMSDSDAMKFGADPFTMQDVVASDAVMVAGIDPTLSTVSSQDFASPVSPSSVVETVAVPVDKLTEIPTAPILKTAEFQTTQPTTEPTSSGWRATR